MTLPPPPMNAADRTPRLRRFFDVRSGTCSYLLGDAGRAEAALVDPVRADCPLYLAVLEELGYRLVYVLETHLHADHVSAAAALRATTGARVVCPRGSGVLDADVLVGDGDRLALGEAPIEVLATPGHTAACVTYRWQERLFTGDALLIGDCGDCTGPDGNAGRLYDSITRRLLPLADELLVYPGHASEQRWVSCIGEERRCNAALCGLSRDEFVRRAKARDAAPPPDMSENLAANRRCGATVP